MTALHVSSYRPDIDGLRAVAVVPVILFHAGSSIFSGGYVGVDVFFVISGYLITSILYREALAGQFSLIRFYERRVRRIFPALFVMIAVCLVAGLFILLPNELAALGRSATAATLFVSNVLFWRESGYFDASSTSKPLLHTWSLAVEEQFYICFPLILWAAFCWLRRWLLMIVIGLTVTSLSLSVLMLPISAGATFYLIPTRAWELLIGSALAMMPAIGRRRTAEIVSMLGITAIVAAVVLYREGMPFPGLTALPPCLGAAALILCGPQTFTGRLLSAAPIRGIGLISFSLYLWHWPVLVYARMLFGDQLSPLVSVGSILIASGCAYLSWRFVEQPFRKPHPQGSARKPLIVGASMLAAFSIFGLGLSSGLAFRLPPEARVMASAAKIPDTSSPGCFLWGGPNGHDLETDCLGQTSGTPKIVLWGDSHANQYALAIHAHASAEGLGFRMVGRAGCPPLLGVIPVKRNQPDPECADFNERILRAILADHSVKLVIMGGRWQRLAFPIDDHKAQRLMAVDARLGDTSVLFTDALRDTALRLRADDKQVIVIGSVPEFSEPLAACMARAVWYGQDTTRCSHNSATLPGNLPDRWVVDAVSNLPNVELVMPSATLCSRGTCERLVSGAPVNSDRDHLSEAAARQVISGGDFARAFDLAIRRIRGS